MLPERAVKVLVKEAYNEFFTEGTVDFYKIAATSAEKVLEINGIGNAYLRDIAMELEELGIIGRDEWLDGKILDANKDPSIEVSTVENDHVALEQQPSIKEELIDRDDIRTMQSYFFPIIGPHSLSLIAMQWLYDNIGAKDLRNKIIEKLVELNLWDRYNLHATLRKETERLANNSEDPKRLRLIKEIINYNKYVASSECKRFFHQGHWDASVAFWIFMDANSIEEEENLINKIYIRIGKSVEIIKNLGYDTSLIGVENILPTLFGEEK